MNTIAIIKVNDYTNGKADKNGITPLFLQPLAGKVPNRAMILNGTMAQREQMFSGDTCMVQFTEGESNEYGRNFTVTNLGKLGPMDLLTAMTTLGEAIVVDTNKAEVPVVAEVPADEIPE